MIDKINLTWVRTVSLISLLSLLGCVVEAKNSGNSDDKDASVVTPVGSLSIKSQGSAEKIGVKLYPGATLKPDTKADHNSNNANINVSTSLFGMSLIVQKYEASDPPEKVIAFYEKELSKFGKVIKCEAGSPSATPEDRKKDAPVTCDKSEPAGDDYKTELKVGTERNQHIVAVKPQGTGTAFALVYVRVRGGEKE